MTPSADAMPNVTIRDLSVQNISSSSRNACGATNDSDSMRPVLVATNASCKVFGSSAT